MQIDTIIVLVVFVGFVIATLAKNTHLLNFSSSHTNELKGLAIFMVLFGHIGYFLSPDNRFLWPLSVASGVGVNIFLFLSGFGLTISHLKEKVPLAKFYKKRFLNIYPTMWVVITFFLLLDFFLLHRTYPLQYVIHSLLGFFPNADLYKDVNSPLWYFTFIVFYYLLFPLLFHRKFPALSALLLLVLGLFVTRQNLPVNIDVLKLYKTHIIAFPLGMIFALVVESKTYSRILERFPRVFRYLLIVAACGIVAYTAIHSSVGQGIYKEQLTSLVTVLALILISILKNYYSKFLVLVGKYSYEIYLLHWPLMSRFDYLFKHLPPFLAVILYMALFLFLAWAYNRILRKRSRRSLWSGIARETSRQ